MIRRTAALILLTTLKTGVSLGLLWSGFRAISDDDFSRVTLAQQFVAHPLLDPSGTSWLPLPFWVYGGAMKIFGGSLATAQLTALVLGIYAAVGVWLIAHALELTPRAALLGSLAAASLPHAAYYGAAMVPDYPTAVLALGAAATLGQRHGPTRLAGAFAACLGTLCRYEVWPIALVVVGYAAFDAWRARHQRRWMLAAAVVAPAGAIAWMLHGLSRHHDALFFFKRVSAYRRALGGEPIPWWSRLLKHPLALITGEPELMVLGSGLFLIAWLALGPSAWRGRVWVRPAWAIGSVIGFLVAGDLLEGSPTHHEERTLLVAWLGVALFVSDLITRLWEHVFTRKSQLATTTRVALVASLGVVLGAAVVIRPLVAQQEPFVARSREIQIGQLARLLVPRGERLAVYTDDYGYFAVQAAFARPLDSVPLLKHDPRRQERVPLSSPVELERQLDVLRVQYLVLPVGKRSTLGKWASVAVENESFLLVKRN